MNSTPSNKRVASSPVEGSSKEMKSAGSSPPLRGGSQSSSSENHSQSLVQKSFAIVTQAGLGLTTSTMVTSSGS